MQKGLFCSIMTLHLLLFSGQHIKERVFVRFISSEGDSMTIMVGNVAAGRKAWSVIEQELRACTLTHNYKTERDNEIVWTFEISKPIFSG